MTHRLCWCRTLSGTKRSQQFSWQTAKSTKEWKRHNNGTKIKAIAFALYFIMICTVTGMVFIGQRFTYPPAIIPILPPNCPKYRIFHGSFGNIRYTNLVDYSWPDTWGSVLLRILRRPASLIRPPPNRPSPSEPSAAPARFPHGFAPFIFGSSLSTFATARDRSR